MSFIFNFKDPCSQLRCSTKEICIPKDEYSASCILREEVETSQNHFLMKRETQTSAEICGSLECRFGKCEVLNETSFVCHCSKVILLEINFV